MGLFDFLKKKPADEKGNAQGGTQAGAQGNAQQSVQDPPFVKDMRRLQVGPWFQHDILIDARIYGWDQMVDWADYMTKADLEDVDEVTIQSMGNASDNLTAEFKNAGSIAGMESLSNEEGILSVAGFSKALGAPTKIVWFNQTNLLRVFTPLDDCVLMLKYAETTIRRLFNTPNAMKMYNQALAGNTGAAPNAAPNPAAQKQSAPLTTEEIYGEYDAELKMYVSRISADQRKEILEYISKNEKIMAVKICREASGSGLKQAKDIVEAYEKYLL